MSNKIYKINEFPQLNISTVLADGNCIINITDNGQGMTESVRKRIFEPFFTTKDPGSGTGLGLSVSFYIIVNGHNGSITAESTPDKGTSFIITLPEKRNF